MTVYFRKPLIALAMAIAISVSAMAQNGSKPLTPLKVQVVIARYEGDKKVSSLPYILAVTANHEPGANLRMGSQVPVPMGQGSVDYKNVGTNIDCGATSTDDGRFRVYVSIEDSSVMERRSNDFPPTLRTFLFRNTVVLKDGQTAQFTAAADKVTGEVVKVDVSLVVEK
ncbi:MAG TPA: hypothetical protein VFR05_04635 [Terriglobia bacterium]|nr:hypothetical protein [Terriglobia bacterium]